jgi:autotransporter adhesin
VASLSTTVVNNYNSLSTSISNVYNSGTKYFHANSTEADSQALGQNSIAIGPKAVASGDGSIAQGYGATSSGTDSIAIGTNANASQINSVALGANSVANGSTLSQAAYNPGGSAVGLAPVGEVSVGSAGAERRITNVAAGAAPTDAVNVSQLQDSQANVTNLIDQSRNQVTNLINKTAKELKGGIAASMAMEAAPYVVGKLTTYMGVGYYDGQSALGFSARKTSDNGRWSLSGGVSASQEGDVGARIGVTRVWD